MHPLDLEIWSGGGDDSGHGKDRGDNLIFAIKHLILGVAKATTGFALVGRGYTTES